MIDAYPDRKVIVNIHGFLDPWAMRPGYTVRPDGLGKSARQIWDQLIYPNCRIFMVLNGHFHDGPDGEARRTDPNACGTPVHQILSDYQDRPNGGDGWLRYYTFHPSRNTIEAHTYSPTRREYETDDDSQFALSYPMSTSTEVPVSLVDGGSSWKWRFAAGEWPSGWQGVGFDDSGWASGGAPLGFGHASVATNIDVPAPTSNRPRAAVFRKKFTVADPSELSDLVVRTRADDGIVVSVNGQEVGRSNMAAGAVTSSTYATAAPRTSAAVGRVVEVAVPSGVLRAGDNVVSVSTHLNYRGTPDVTFDLTLTGIQTH